MGGLLGSNAPPCPSAVVRARFIACLARNNPLAQTVANQRMRRATLARCRWPARSCAGFVASPRPVPHDWEAARHPQDVLDALPDAAPGLAGGGAEHYRHQAWVSMPRRHRKRDAVRQCRRGRSSPGSAAGPRLRRPRARLSDRVDGSRAVGAMLLPKKLRTAPAASSISACRRPRRDGRCSRPSCIGAGREAARGRPGRAMRSRPGPIGARSIGLVRAVSLSIPARPQRVPPPLPSLAIAFFAMAPARASEDERAVAHPCTALTGGR